MNFTTEQIAKARAAKSAEELFSLAKAGGVPMTEDEAKKYFDALHTEGELSDTELDTVAGGTKNPQAYSVGASWAPSCDGRYVGSTGLSPSLPTVCCGKCRYFEYDGEITNNVWGVCLREFE